MKRNVIASFIAGAVLFGTVGVFAGQYVATENPFPIQLNGENVDIKGFNIDGSTYFNLRDIANVIGGVDVGFFNGTIQLAKDGYVYDNSTAEKYSKYIGRFYLPLQDDQRYWFGYQLDITAIDGKTVVFDYQHPKPGRAVGYTAEPAVFVDENTAVGKGTFELAADDGKRSDVIYTLKFEGDIITINIKFADTGEGYDEIYDINTDLRSNYDLAD